MFRFFSLWDDFQCRLLNFNDVPSAEEKKPPRQLCKEVDLLTVSEVQQECEILIFIIIFINTPFTRDGEAT